MDGTVLIDKLAEKLNQAKEQVLPLAQEVVRQYGDKKLCSGICLLSFGVISSICFIVALRKFMVSMHDDDCEENIRNTYMIAVAVSAMAVVIFYVAGFSDLLSGLYPLAELMTAVQQK